MENEFQSEKQDIEKINLKLRSFFDKKDLFNKVEILNKKIENQILEK